PLPLAPEEFRFPNSFSRRALRTNPQGPSKRPLRQVAPEVLFVAFRLFPERRLGGRQAGDRHAEWRAAHVIHADFVAEVDAVGVAAVFAADADFEVLVVLGLAAIATFFDADLHQLT